MLLALRSLWERAAALVSFDIGSASSAAVAATMAEPVRFDLSAASSASFGAAEAEPVVFDVAAASGASFGAAETEPVRFDVAAASAVACGAQVLAAEPKAGKADGLAVIYGGPQGPELKRRREPEPDRERAAAIRAMFEAAIEAGMDEAEAVALAYAAGRRAA